MVGAYPRSGPSRRLRSNQYPSVVRYAEALYVYLKASRTEGCGPPTSPRPFGSLGLSRLASLLKSLPRRAGTDHQDQGPTYLCNKAVVDASPIALRDLTRYQDRFITVDLLKKAVTIGAEKAHKGHRAMDGRQLPWTAPSPLASPLPSRKSSSMVWILRY